MAQARREIVVVTGGSAGIGRATVREFAAHGCDVAVIARGRERIDAACREVEAEGGRALGIVADVADNDALEAAAARIEAELGPIDIWINNAFAGMFATFMDMSDAEFRRVVDVTFMGAVNGTRAALRRMVPRNSGTIVQVGSALAHRGIPLQSAYCSAKHAMLGFLDAVRSELSGMDSAIHMTMVQLPAVNTPQFDWARAKVQGEPRPVGKIYQPEVAARAIRFAAYSDRKEVWVGHTSAQAILGNRVASPLLDTYLGATGIEGQQGDRLARTGRPDNLFDVPPGDPGAHGRFDERAWDYSVQMWANRNRGLLATGAAVAAGVGLALLSRSSRAA
ncbi:MAG: SDR family oxidoreductase [Allosphingosinicella sp.]|uniref:SDR family oxidoreductase n=1 Tax=Allosphingosinicella sp. TaxID=2823234 RepID=UPI0039425B03